jgi:ParB family chromosome partitioning protein
MDKLVPAAETASKRKKLALGRGLGALIPDADTGLESSGDYFMCDTDLIRPNRFQPRRRFNEAELQELMASIREQGVLQPLIVRKNPPGFELVAGERRWRAARQVGLAQVPVVLKPVTDDQLLEMSLIENIQREDLNPMEQAEAYQSLITQLSLTQDQVATRVGKSRSTVANFLRLRNLPEQVKESIVAGDLSMGHARALLASENAAHQLAAWREVVAQGLSVRETENLMRRLKTAPKAPRGSSKRSSEDIHLASLAEDLSRQLGTKVLIRSSGRQGRIEIEFYSNDDLDRLIARLRQTQP